MRMLIVFLLLILGGSIQAQDEDVWPIYDFGDSIIYLEVPDREIGVTHISPSGRYAAANATLYDDDFNLLALDFLFVLF